MMLFWIRGLPWLIAWWLVAGMNASAAAPLRVLTSFFPVYCLTVNVAGNLAQVENLLPAGVGPHDFQFSPRDLRKLHEADLLIINGLNLETWLEEALANQSEAKPKNVVKITQGMAVELITEAAEASSQTRGDAKPDPAPGSMPKHSEHGGGPDPHIWLDPVLATQAVTNILQALQNADPVHSASYASNAMVYLKRLEKLDADYRQALAPLKTNAFITYHQAFLYLVRRYDLRLAGVIEETPDVEPSPRHLSLLSQVIHEQHVPVIFTEPQYSNRIARQLAEDTKTTVGELDTLETGPLTPGGYEASMRRNLGNLVKGLSRNFSTR